MPLHVVGVGDHRAQLEDADRPPFEADPSLPIQGGPLGLQADGGAEERDRDQAEQDDGERERHVEGALREAVGQAAGGGRPMRERPPAAAPRYRHGSLRGRRAKGLCRGRRASSKRPPPQHYGGRARDHPEVHQERALLDVGEVHGHHVVEGGVAAAPHLPVAGEAGLDGQAAHGARVVLGDLGGERRARAHAGELAHEAVQELGELVDRFGVGRINQLVSGYSTAMGIDLPDTSGGRGAPG